ncbi:MAG: diaminopimelate epimerase [Phycisphaerae bacterium]|nr:diaminopimelate epimerase [Phycisphaerae bacterium]
MRFTKMHGLGNDYVYVNCFTEQVLDPQDVARRVSSRHFSIGSDGLILIMPTDHADVRMRMFNADGSESEMCGNGVRCVAKYSYDHQLTEGRVPSQPVCERLLRSALPEAEAIREMTVETGNGVLTLGMAISNGKVQQVCVDMGEPILTPGEIPVRVEGDTAISTPIAIEGYDLQMTCVSMGNPHAVFYCLDVEALDLERLGAAIEMNEIFPQRVNVHFVQVLSKNEVIMRTWERGSGITLACGTGASAVCVAGVLTNNNDRQVLIHLPGGDLQLLWNQDDNHVYMVGPATEVYHGQY